MGAFGGPYASYPHHVRSSGRGMRVWLRSHGLCACHGCNNTKKEDTSREKYRGLHSQGKPEIRIIDTEDLMNKVKAVTVRGWGRVPLD